MRWFRVIFFIILMDQLDCAQNKVTEDYEETTTAMDETTLATDNCSIVSNLSVRHIYDDDYISLNISWDTINLAQPKTYIHFEMRSHNQSDCDYIDTALIDLSKGYVKRPTANPENKINPSCDVEIKLNNENNCRVVYHIPDCVCNDLNKDVCVCNCTKYGPRIKILSVQSDSDNDYIIKWDSETISYNNRTYTINEAFFNYREKNKGSHGGEAVIRTKDYSNNMAKVDMKIFEGEEYTLIAEFGNNLSPNCLQHINFDFTVPKSNKNHILIFMIVTGFVLIIAVSHNIIIKHAKKFVSIVFFRSNLNVVQNVEVPLIPLQNSQVPMATNTIYVSEDPPGGDVDEYEFPRGNIFKKEDIGNGAFGQVFSAKALGIGGVEGYKMVAVKTLGGNITKDAMTDFMAEIEIFKKIGNHPNVVTLLGCCTREPPYMMIMEFVPCGDLKNYLLELRDQWLMKKNRQVFFPDTSDGAYIEPAPHSPISITSSRLPSTSETVCTTLEDPMTPLLVHYQQALERVLDHNELQAFALQIAKGMSHLEKIEITHRDLAARNILINEFKTLKISDFGLSRKGPYVNHKSRKLPLRWMAPEAVVEQKYDSKSDVWSFGVVLWEIGTLGAFPYESVPDSFIVQFLQMGGRLDRPEICTDELYNLMGQCWAREPEARPTFADLVDLLDVKKRKIYVNFSQLNPTYVFPPCEISYFMQSPVQTVDIDM